MTSPHDDAVECEVRIKASCETVFSYFTDPQKMLAWKGVSATLDPQPGGIYRVHVSGSHIARGCYVELVPYSRVVFTWGWEGEESLVPPGSTTVEIDLTEDGGATVLRLRHTGLSHELIQQHAQGWSHYLPRLVVAAGGGDSGPDPLAAPQEYSVPALAASMV